MSLSISTHNTDPSHVTLTIAGEVDVANANELTQAFDAILEQANVEEINVDMADVPYIDSTGIGVLMAASKSAEDAEVKLKVSNPQPPVLRVFTLLGVVAEFNMDNQEK